MGLSLSFAELSTLLKKYDRPAPRYTSYPPANHFCTEVGPPDYADQLGRCSADDRVSLYLHIPFCTKRCTYCGCFVVPAKRQGIAETYLDHLQLEADALARCGGDGLAVDSVHLGGGTPTYLTPEQLDALFDLLSGSLNLDSLREISVEVDPRVTTPEQLAVLCARGARRVSLGVQDASDDVQEAIGRHQTWDDTLRCFNACREAGFDSVNIDLVYGLPLQTERSFEETLRKINGLKPDRLAVFGYAHVPWVRPQQRRIDESTLPGPEDRLRLWLCAHRSLTEAGYKHIGLDHYALPNDDLVQAQACGRLGRNFMGYTTFGGSKVIGMGVSSIGDLHHGYFQNEKKLATYFNSLQRGELPVERGWLLTSEDQLRRYVIQEILCNLHLEYAPARRQYGSAFSNLFGEALKELEELETDGLIRIDWQGLEVTELGRLFLRNIGTVFDAYLGRHQDKTPVYSRTL